MKETTRPPLSEREQEILDLLATGATNQEIARALHISPNTVKVHLRNIYAKLDVMNRSEAILVGLQKGLVSIPGVPSPPHLEPLSAPSAMPVRMPRLQFVLLLAAILGLGLVAFLLIPPLSQQQATATGMEDVIFSDVGQAGSGLPTRRTLPRWVPQTPLDVPLSRMAVATWQGRIFCFGGETPNGVVAATRIYVPQRGAWGRGAAKPTPVSNAQAAVIGSRIYVFGGTDAAFHPTKVVEIYDPANDTWTRGTPLPHPLAGYALAVWKGKVFLFGGWDGRHYLSSAYEYLPAQDRWQILPPMDAPRAFATASLLDNVIYLVGGYDGQVDTADVWTFNPGALEAGENPWAQVESMLAPRGGAASAVLTRSLYIIGGGISLPADGAERYDPTTNTWARMETPYGPNWRDMGVAVIGGDILTVGGWAGVHLPFVEKYRASFRNFIPYGPVNQGD